MLRLACSLAFTFTQLVLLRAQDAPATIAPPSTPFVVYTADQGPGVGKRIVFVTGEEEYRSEESMPQLARILAVRHGFHCTVLFATEPKTGVIDPGVVDNIPGLDALDRADLMVLFTRFRNLPDAQMQHVVDYVESGRPIVALRTSTHAFALAKESKFASWSWDSKVWSGGFGRQVLGETWIAHHGEHGVQGTRGVIAPGAADTAILRGFTAGSVWDPADVYRVRLPLPEGCAPVLLGEVTATMRFDAPAVPAQGELMPIAWTRTWPAPNGKAARIFTTTLGSAEAFAQAGTRRLLVNACFWALDLEKAITKDLDVEFAGSFTPSAFGFGKHRKGVRPADLVSAPPANAAAK